MLYMAKTRPVLEDAVPLERLVLIKIGGLGDNEQVEEVLVRLHSIDSTHQATIVAIEASAQICHPKNSIQSPHARCPGAIASLVDLLRELDGIIDLGCCCLVDIGLLVIKYFSALLGLHGEGQCGTMST